MSKDKMTYFFKEVRHGEEKRGYLIKSDQSQIGKERKREREKKESEREKKDV